MAVKGMAVVGHGPDERNWTTTADEVAVDGE